MKFFHRCRDVAHDPPETRESLQKQIIHLIALGQVQQEQINGLTRVSKHLQRQTTALCENLQSQITAINENLQSQIKALSENLQTGGFNR